MANVVSGIKWLHEQRQLGAEANLQQASLSNLNDPHTAALVAIAHREGATLYNGLLEPSARALQNIADEFPDQKLILRKNGVDKVIPITKAIDITQLSGEPLSIGFPYTSTIEASLKKFFPNKALGVESVLADASFKASRSAIQNQAEKDFYETIKECTLPPEEYKKWLHVHQAQFGCNQHELYVGGWLQLTYKHLEWLLRHDPTCILMTRNEQLPVEPAMRWETITAKSALFKEQEKRAADPNRSQYTDFYVFCADPERAMQLSELQPSAKHLISRVITKLQTRTWFQSAAIVVGLITTVLAGLFTDVAKDEAKKILKDPKDLAPVIRSADELEAASALATKHADSDSKIHR